MFKQAGILFPPPDQVNGTLVWVAAVLVGGPGVLTVLGAIFSATGTGSSPSPPAAPELPPSSLGESTSGGNHP